MIGFIDRWLQRRASAQAEAERQKWRQEREEADAAKRAREAAEDASADKAWPMTDARYRKLYLTFQEGRHAFASDEADLRRPCGCFLHTDHDGRCKSNQRRFKREHERRQAEVDAGRMTELDLRGIVPAPRQDWIDELAGRP